jgi:hypothetical protein
MEASMFKLNRLIAAFGALAFVFAFAGNPVLACDCTNCSAAHCPDRGDVVVSYTIEKKTGKKSAAPDQLTTKQPPSQPKGHATKKGFAVR